jgi:hypothetical protein
MGRMATIGLFVCSAALTFVLDTAKDNFDIILQVGAGTGLLYLVRWFWWRVNAWSEVVAMVSSFAASVMWFVMHKYDMYVFAQNQWFVTAPDISKIESTISTQYELLLTILFTTVCWVLTAYFGPQTDRATLIAFYKKIYPPGPGWERIRKEAGVSTSEARAHAENIPMAMLGWMAGCTMIWSALFAVGNFLYGRYSIAIWLTVMFIISALLVNYVVNRIWAAKAT